MELRVIILSVACLSCLLPPALATHILAAKAAKGAVIAKGALLAKGALAAKGALIAKGVLAAKGILAAKKAIAAKGLLLAKSAAAAIAAKGAAAVAAKAAAVRGAALLAQGAAAQGAALLAAKGAAIQGVVGAVKGAAVAKAATLGALIHKPIIQPVGIPIPPPIGIPAIFPVPVGPPVGRDMAIERAEPSLSSLSEEDTPAIDGRIAEWTNLISRALAQQTGVAAELVNAVQQRGRTPTVYEMIGAPRLYPAPVIEKVNSDFLK